MQASALCAYVVLCLNNVNQVFPGIRQFYRLLQRVCIVLYCIVFIAIPWGRTGSCNASGLSYENYRLKTMDNVFILKRVVIRISAESTAL